MFGRNILRCGAILVFAFVLFGLYESLPGQAPPRREITLDGSRTKDYKFESDERNGLIVFLTLNSKQFANGIPSQIDFFLSLRSDLHRKWHFSDVEADLIKNDRPEPLGPDQLSRDFPGATKLFRDPRMGLIRLKPDGEYRIKLYLHPRSNDYDVKVARKAIEMDGAFKIKALYR